MAKKVKRLSRFSCRQPKLRDYLGRTFSLVHTASILLFVKQFNDRTGKDAGNILPVVVPF